MELRDSEGKEVELVNVKKVKLRRGGKDYMDTLPWYSDGKEWYVERSRIADYIKES